ncbi:hypothetical protein V5799_029143 [Amblyomma americanum]|uniref:Dynamin-type G domain-containing protein n=1 Tax=Amblyomma americanum TaxID=6943 RepID=A0AAQ4ES19_AMBAM
MESFKTQDCAEVEKFKDKITGIRDVLSRDHMKVVFFGRTSNGKSTVINSMLQDKILPSGLGHTTNCFLQVEGSDSSEAYLLTEDSNEPKNVESVLQLANALNSESLGESTLVRVFWPKDRCSLLRDDVVLVDRSEKQNQRREQWERLQFTQQQLQLLTEEAKQRIGQLVEQVEQQVAGALSEEIRRLELLVGEFERPFHPDPLVLGVYKRELHAYVERGLGCNLRARLSNTLQMSVESAQKEMIGRMSSLIPSEQQPQMLNVLPRHNFEVLYRLNCESLCCDFQEDLSFHFSFGLVNMIKFFTQYRKADPAVGGSYLNSMVRAIGWKVIAVAVGTYGALYLFERLTWTNRAKERCFKRQYVQHATRKLRLIVDLTSANCSHQVQQELSSTFARLGHVVDEVVNEMDSDIKKLDKEMAKMEEATTNARTLRNKAGYLMSELETFSQQYLQYDQ